MRKVFQVDNTDLKVQTMQYHVCNPTTSSALAFQQASIKDIHIHWWQSKLCKQDTKAHKKVGSLPAFLALLWNFANFNVFKNLTEANSSTKIPGKTD